MAVAKRQEARENRAEHGQREAQDRGEDFRQSGAPAQAVCIGQAQGEKKHIKRAAEGFSLSHAWVLSLSPPPTNPPGRWGALLFASLDRRALTPRRWIFLLSSK